MTPSLERLQQRRSTGVDLKIFKALIADRTDLQYLAHVRQLKGKQTI